jgi:hypothetical protein
LGFGVGVTTEGPRRGRFGWAGGQDTDFFVDRDGTVGILLTQAALGEKSWPMLEEFQALHEADDLGCRRAPVPRFHSRAGFARLSSR